jgi:hypothetical protein
MAGKITQVDHRIRHEGGDECAAEEHSTEVDKPFVLENGSH